MVVLGEQGRQLGRTPGPSLHDRGQAQGLAHQKGQSIGGHGQILVPIVGDQIGNGKAGAPKKISEGGKAGPRLQDMIVAKGRGQGGLGHEPRGKKLAAHGIVEQGPVFITCQAQVDIGPLGGGR